MIQRWAVIINVAAETNYTNVRKKKCLDKGSYFFVPLERNEIELEIQTKEESLTAPHDTSVMAFGRRLAARAALLSTASNFRCQERLVTLLGFG